MLYDPIDAFFQGITSAIVRVPLAFLPLLVALSCFCLPNSELGAWGVIAFPFVMLGVIVAWATYGVAFFIGFIAFLAYLLLAWRFIQTDYPKEMFLALFVVAFVLFVPLIWDAPSRPWISFALGGGILSVYLLLSYGLPIVLERLDKGENA